MRTKSTGGFTLIELLIVIAIIGILAAVLIPNLMSARTRAFDTASQACAKGLATASEIWAIDNNGDYTGVTVAWAEDNGANACDSAQITATLVGADATGYEFTVVHSGNPTLTWTVDEDGITNNAP